MTTIQEELKCQRKPLNDTLQALVKQGKIECSGSGKKGDPYLYCSAPEGPEKAVVSAACREQKLFSDPEGLGPEKKLFRCSRHIMGNGKNRIIRPCGEADRNGPR